MTDVSATMTGIYDLRTFFYDYFNEMYDFGTHIFYFITLVAAQAPKAILWDWIISQLNVIYEMFASRSRLMC